ncbi:hypothetical protein HYW21_00650 [Candidatus Woesearchaeota archaeon]|nr:hypothetical protein [Candidatus Woesearchaeota archaeon]
MSEKEELIKIGLTQRESDAYLTLLQLQEATVKEISDKTKESRTHLYDTLKSLIDRGLVSYAIKNNIKYFHAAPPDRLLDYLKEKETSVLRILPLLKELHKPKIKKPLVEVYEDKEGMKTILNDIIRTKKEWLALGSTGKGPHVLPLFFLERFHKERVKNNIRLKVLCNRTREGKQRGKEFLKYPLTEVKYLPKTHQSPTTVYVYGNKAAIFMWLAGDKPFAILIASPEISNSFQSYFYLLWKTSQKAP